VIRKFACQNPSLGDAKNLPFPKEGISTVEMDAPNIENKVITLETSIIKKSELLYEVNLSAKWVENENGELKKGPVGP
jgi:hypothetical protein